MKRCLVSLSIRQNLTFRCDALAHLLGWLLFKKWKIMCRQGCGEIGTYGHFLWKYKMVQLLKNGQLRFFIKLNIELLYDPGVVLLGTYPSIFTTFKRWKQYKPWMTVYSKYGIYIQENIIQPWKRVKFWYMLQLGWTLMTSWNKQVTRGQEDYVTPFIWGT